MLSIYPPDCPYTVYHHEAWFSDKWNALDYGRGFDFSRPFFEQFDDLMRVVPLMSMNIQSIQNCEYVNECGNSKNCYFTVEADENEDCMYAYRAFDNKTSVDCLETFNCERCYEIVDCRQCFNLLHSQFCTQCRDSAFLYDCKSCTQCFGCVGLRQKKYHMFNEELSKEEYEKRMQSFSLCNPEHVKAAKKRFEDLKLTHPRKAIAGEQNDNCSGNYIYNSKDCFYCFNIRECRDCRYCDYLLQGKDCMDFFVFGEPGEKSYECQTCGYGTLNLRFCCRCWEGVQNLTYCLLCVQTVANCFGCVGLQKKEYCILNKQYTKDEYERLVPKIIEHMKKTGEWGEFFPIETSPHAYNESYAMDHMPLKKEEVLQRKWKWRDELPITKGKETITHDDIPKNIDDVPDSICNEVLACRETERNYRITKQELLYYRAMKLPIPHLHFYERHRKRLAMRNPRQLWKRECMKCKKEIETTYSPDRSETVFCEECYLKEVY